jgi:hypothetical protein
MSVLILARGAGGPALGGYGSAGLQDDAARRGKGFQLYRLMPEGGPVPTLRFGRAPARGAAFQFNGKPNGPATRAAVAVQKRRAESAARRRKCPS